MKCNSVMNPDITPVTSPNFSSDKPLEALSDAKLSRVLDPTYVKAWYREV